jgi:manganese/iron transport system permease protein/iron/zinc/copper transport system permease protein
MDILIAPFKFEFFRNGAAAAILIGVLCGLLGVYVVLRGMSYIGHGLSHAVFGGAAVAFIMKWDFYLGAGTWGFLAAVLINQTVRRFRINADAAIGIITTASFAVGVAVISRLHRFTQDLEASLFGSILGVTPAQLFGVAAVTVLVGLGIFLLYRQLLFTTFDEETARAYGVRTQWIDSLFSLALASAIIVSMQVIGVTLIAAALVIPPITARMLTDRIDRMLLISMAVGAVTGLGGIYLSYYLDTSSGATIVLTQAAVFLVVLVINVLRGRSRLTAIDYHV